MGSICLVGLHEAAGLPLHAADDHQGPPMTIRASRRRTGFTRRMGQRDKHLLGLTAIPSCIVLVCDESTVVVVLVPEPLKDTLCRVALFPGTPEIILEGRPAADASSGLLLSLPKGWASLAETADDNPTAPNRPASCELCHGAVGTPGPLPARSSHPPSPPGEPADIRPLCTSIAPSMGSDKPCE